MVVSTGYKPGFEALAKLVIAALVLILLMAKLIDPVEAAPKFSAIAIDARTGKILFSKNGDAKRYPASLTKMMTLYLVFEDLKAGRIKMSTPFRVSRYAASRPPSKLGFKPGRSIQVRHAIRALVTKSANDVATAIAENLGGSESGFARRMTSTARRIGMTRTTFRNASGLPNRSQLTTARDMATLGLRLQHDFPRYYKFFAIKRFTYRGRRYGNHNRLLGRIRGVDGIKTGYTRASGFNLTTSARRGKKRIVAVVMGGRTGRSRNRYMTALVKRMFAKKRLVSSSRIAMTAGSPPGYHPVRRKTRIVQLINVPLPMKKPIRIAEKKPVKVVEKKPVTVAALIPQKPLVDESELKVPDVPESIEKQQDRLVKSGEVSTFKTVGIIDEDDSTDILEFNGVTGSTKVRSSDKADFAMPKRIKVRRVVKITDRILPDDEQPVAKQTVQVQASKASKTRPAVKPRQAAAQHNDSWNIQIGAFPSNKSAKGRLAHASKTGGNSLRGKVAFTVEVKKNGSKFYRARFAGFNRKAASRACRTLKKKGFGCFTLAPQS